MKNRQNTNSNLDKIFSLFSLSDDMFHKATRWPLNETHLQAIFLSHSHGPVLHTATYPLYMRALHERYVRPEQNINMLIAFVYSLSLICFSLPTASLFLDIVSFQSPFLILSPLHLNPFLFIQWWRLQCLFNPSKHRGNYTCHLLYHSITIFCPKCISEFRVILRINNSYFL